MRPSAPTRSRYARSLSLLGATSLVFSSMLNPAAANAQTTGTETADATFIPYCEGFWAKNLPNTKLTVRVHPVSDPYGEPIPATHGMGLGRNGGFYFPNEGAVASFEYVRTPENTAPGADAQWTKVASPCGTPAFSATSFCRGIFWNLAMINGYASRWGVRVETEIDGREVSAVDVQSGSSWIVNLPPTPVSSWTSRAVVTSDPEVVIGEVTGSEAECMPGPEGPQGPQGPAGQDGQTGPQGPAGTNGTVVESTTTITRTVEVGATTGVATPTKAPVTTVPVQGSLGSLAPVGGSSDGNSSSAGNPLLWLLGIGVASALGFTALTLQPDDLAMRLEALARAIGSSDWIGARDLVAGHAPGPDTANGRG